MVRCGYSEEERQAFEGSAIRSEHIRHAREKAAFARESDDAHDTLMARQEFAEDDLVDLDVDEGYIQSLCKETARYVQDHYDFDERREGQLREIVSMGYDVMTQMRERIAMCQSYTGDEMSGLGRRLDALEVVVHRSLEELVKLAEGANISTKGQPALNMKSKARMDSTVSSLRSLDASMRTKGMMTGSLHDVLDNLKEKDEERSPQKKRPTQRSIKEVKVRTSAAPQPTQSNKPTTAVEGWHRGAQRVGVAGKRVLRSAREEWADK